MNAEPPAVPDSFILKLNKFDPDLGIEWCGDHYCIVDETKPIARYKRDRGGLIIVDDYRTVYDRLFHLQVGRVLDGSVIDEMQFRDMNRFGDKKYAAQELNRLANKAEEDRQKEEADFNDATISEIKTFKRFGVTVPGRAKEKQHGRNTGKK